MGGLVLQVITDTDRRGAQTFALDLEEALVACGLRVRTVALAPGRSPNSHDAPVLGRRRLTGRTLLALRPLIRDASVVVAHGSTTLPACVLAGTGLSTALVYRNIGDPLYWAHSPARRIRVRTLLRRTAAVVALWRGSSEVLASRFDVARSRLHVIPNGVPSTRCTVSPPEHRREARRSLGLDPATPTAAYVGALSREKSLHLAISASRDLGTQLLLAGDGPLRLDLESQARSQAPGLVRFLGVVSDPAVVYAAADLVVLPSESEGMPGMLIEAGLSGLGAVASDVGAVREVIANGRTGVVISPGNKSSLAQGLEQGFTNAEQFGVAARIRCLERFEITPVASAWQRLLTPFLPTTHGARAWSR
ncbi:MAG: glycosyltransferase family 4 protein [Nitriliruptorales bacterium]|nr:glycosyltransferase family 4 protein [Nitriliruptorales bacterium]